MKSNMRQRIIIIILAIMIGVGVPEFINNYFSEAYDVNIEESSDGQATGDDSYLDKVKFVRAVDGDTIIVEDSGGSQNRVRLIGIDTPESVAAEEERNNEYGVMASDYTKELLSNIDTLYLEYDVDIDDQYDRILAYVWLDDVEDTFDEKTIEESMINAIIVKNGYGIAKRYEPTVAHDNTLQRLTKEANNANAGLWQYEGFRNLWK